MFHLHFHILLLIVSFCFFQSQGRALPLLTQLESHYAASEVAEDDDASDVADDEQDGDATDAASLLD